MNFSKGALLRQFVPRQRSFLISIGVTFALGYAISDVGHFFLANVTDYDQWSRDRSVEMVGELKVGALLLKHGELKGLMARMADLRASRLIDFYLIRKQGKTVDLGAPEEELRSVDRDYAPNRVVMDSWASYGSVAVGDYLLVIGSYQRLDGYLKFLFRQSKGELIADVLIVAGIAFAVVLYFFKDILQLIRVIRRKEGGVLEDVIQSGLSKEAVIMAQGIRAYERQSLLLQSDRKNLLGSVRQSVKSELDSGEKPPYQFDCVMVRTDINDYSIIYSTYPVDEFMGRIDDFFSQASQVIALYGGYVADFVGDEIIYYFKEDDRLRGKKTGSAAEMAISAIRDIHGVAERISKKTRENSGYPFNVKSALSEGSLRFGRQAKGFALSGGVFVETVRILSQAPEPSDKIQNSVYLPERLLPRVSRLCTPQFRREIALRGVPGMSRLYSVNSFVSCESVITAISENRARQSPSLVSAVQKKTDAPALNMLGYFRSDADLVSILRFMTTGAPLEILQGILSALGEIDAPTSDVEVRDTWVALFEFWLAQKDCLAQGRESRVLGQALSASRRIISPDVFNPRLGRIYTRCLVSLDPRVISNAVDALIHFDPLSSNSFVNDLIRHPDHRVVANALLKLGRVHLGSDVISGLRGMIRSEHARNVASACYAIGELARVYRATDLPYYETHFPFHELLAEIERFVTHDDLMVRKQAALALRKAKAGLEPSQGPNQSAVVPAENFNADDGSKGPQAA